MRMESGKIQAAQSPGARARRAGLRALAVLAGAIAVAALGACRSESASRNVDGPGAPGAPPVATEHTIMSQLPQSEEEWKDHLTEDQFRICRLKMTEPAFTGKYWDHKEDGVYACAACGVELFPSDAKYDSGSGWPSFWAPVADGAIATERDDSLGMVRTEILCQRCGSHLGHVFEDGPQPTGLRYCVNSASLNFQKAPDEGV